MKDSARPRRPTLLSVRRDFERWRSRRTAGSRIPAELWDAAAEVAEADGVSKTARALGLEYYALEKRLERVGPRTPQFVELVVPSSASAAECRLELKSSRGAQLLIELRGAAISQLEPLVRSFWSAGR